MPLLVFFLVLFLPGIGAARSAAAFPEYILNVRFDIPASRISGTASISVPAEQELELYRGRLEVTEVLLNGKRAAGAVKGDKIRIRAPRGGRVEIKYTAIFPPSSSEPGAGGEGVIDSRGIFLAGAWYPRPEEMSIYRLEAALPAGYEAVSEAESVTRSPRDGGTVFRFSFPHPVDQIHLIASRRYQVTEERVDGVTLAAYFFSEDAHLAPVYLSHARKYLQKYGRLLGAYGYKRFSIVENFLPTGYSMPTFTLLGQEVVRLPFIVETSLGHEILHQWFGNLVYVDYASGNWCEGLTTYLADHLYEEEKGQGFAYRKNLLINYGSYVHPENELSLRQFTAQRDSASRSVGYGKCALVFHMLKKELGEEIFMKALRAAVQEMRFRQASWEDLRTLFERESKKDLSGFFRQWVEGKGLAGIHLEEVKAQPAGSRYEVSFTAVQKSPPYTVKLPVVLYSPRGKTEHIFSLSREKETFRLISEEIPARIAVDENYDLARELSPPEFPAVIARLLGARNPVIVPPSSGAGLYGEVTAAFRGRGGTVKEAREIREEDIKGHSFVILGAENPLLGRFYGSVKNDAAFSLEVRENPWDSRSVVAIFQAGSGEEVSKALPKIFHYGRYSFVSFEQGRNVSKKTAESGRGMVRELIRPAVAVGISTLTGLPEVIERVSGMRIIYIGESHDRFAHHALQLEVIRELARRGKKIAIGMEMFQRPFQEALDDYVAGRIEEREFLRRSEYFERWRYDYRLYRPILLFARAEKIPVVALNMPAEVVEKVARGGIDVLPPEEKRLLPEMDFSDEAYRERLRQAFRQHGTLKERPFDYFYQSQVLWDETMAESVDRFLRSRPEHQMVVLAGSGHIAHGSGIPRRAARRNGFPYAVLLNDGELEKGIADYLLFPPEVPPPSSPKLNVLLEEEKEKKEVKIVGFPEESASEKAGMKKGDVILAIGETPVQRIADLRIDLLLRQKGEKVSVKVRRDQPPNQPEVLSFEVLLQ